MTERRTEIVERSETRTVPPRRYRVLLHNDDYTTMEFVVDVLQRHFGKPLPEAMRLMLQVHREGVAIAGVYSREVAETKVTEVSEEARQQDMPLLVTAEPDE